MIPFVLFLGLLLVALVPWFTLFLPLSFHLGGLSAPEDRVTLAAPSAQRKAPCRVNARQ